MQKMLSASFLLAALTISHSPIVNAEMSENSHRASVPVAGNTTLPMETIRASRFRYIDLNDDGYVTSEEIDVFNQMTGEHPILRSQFRTLDENRDNRLSEAEYTLFGAAGNPSSE